jgi:hypothetical protein
MGILPLPICAIKLIALQSFNILIQKLTASVVYWSELLATDPEIRVRFPALSDLLRSSGFWNAVYSASSVQVRSYLEEKVAAPV